jgi:alpha-1,2-glucosyltransferase
LYAFSVLTLKVFRGACTATNLRLFNVFALLSLTTYIIDIRSILTSPSRVPSLRKLTNTSAEAIHTAVNIALFPPLFFFSGLFYTDVLSTRFVLEAYRLFLIRKGADDNSGKGLVMNYVIGLLALTARQTNIFWVAIYLAGLESLRALEMSIVPEGPKDKTAGEEPDPVMTEIKKWGRGNIHDVPLENANLIGKPAHPFCL